MEEANKHGISKALERMSRQVSKAPAKPAPKAPIPASQRPPSSGQGRSAPASPVSRREAQIRALVEDGYTREDATSILITGGK
jgi:hypothetical protein